ncbi:2349_t:CDS:2 [Paraglomus occultum]|uniref:2349_t:CDS:1 n=1 Tax=Paraglomus occultum TaxID=144539 RepID=A0A9N8WIX6_9GLOM|nr:2349_t:CDS:2 [Paraglomus occultum]
MPKERVVVTPKQTASPYGKADKNTTSKVSNISEKPVKGKKATTHTGSSIRTEEKKRKTVFKAVLDSPFNINWPNVSKETQEEILQVLCSTLSSFGESKCVRKSKDIVIGLNAVTRRLESQPESLDSLLRMVFVCKNDISPPILYAHIPVMAAISPSLLLVALPFGAERRLSELLSVKRVACIGIKRESTGFDNLYELVQQKVPPISAPWLNGVRVGFDYQSPNVKTLVTSAPVEKKRRQTRNERNKLPQRTK